LLPLKDSDLVIYVSFCFFLFTEEGRLLETSSNKSYLLASVFLLIRIIVYKPIATHPTQHVY